MFGLQVKWKRVVTYFKAVGLKYCLLLMLLYEASEGLSLMGNIWLSRWTEDPILNAAVNVMQNHRELQQRNVYYLGCYVSFGIGQGMSHLLEELLTSTCLSYNSLIPNVFSVAKYTQI